MYIETVLRYYSATPCSSSKISSVTLITAHKSQVVKGFSSFYVLITAIDKESVIIPHAVNHDWIFTYAASFIILTINRIIAFGGLRYSPCAVQLFPLIYREEQQISLNRVNLQIALHIREILIPTGETLIVQRRSSGTTTDNDGFCLDHLTQKIIERHGCLVIGRIRDNSDFR